MARQFSLVYLTTPSCSPPELIYMAARTGFDFVSPRTIPMGLANEPPLRLSADKDLLRQTKRALSATGIRVHDVENARIFDGVRMKDYRPDLEIAAELGARLVLTNIWTPDRAFTVEALAELGDLAKPLGLDIILEFVTWSNVTSFNEAAAIVREAGRDNIGIILDTLHFNRSRCSLADIERAPAGLVKLVHLCDAPAEIPSSKDDLVHTGRAARLYPGDGGIDIAAIVAKLPPMVYGIEIPNLEYSREIGNAEHVFRAIAKTKAYLDRHLK